MNTDNEIWHVIDDAPDYEVSSLGRVRSWLKAGAGACSPNPRRAEPKLLTIHKNTDGYSCATLKIRGKHRIRTVHRLVLETFTQETSMGRHARHLDNNKQNNAISNLKWGSAEENQADRRLVFDSGETGIPYVKLNKSKANQIRILMAAGIPTADVADTFNMTPAAIRNVVAGRSWPE